MKRSLIFILLLFPAMSFSAIPDFPMAFWGIAIIDGTNAPVGSVISVYDDLTKVGEIVVQENGVYGYTEPKKQKLIISSGRGSLTFKIQSSLINGGIETAGVSPVTHPGFVSGETVYKNLVFTVTKVSSGGGSVSGSGGGGGGAKETLCHSSNTITVIKSTVVAHLKHGDTKGACDRDTKPKPQVLGASTSRDVHQAIPFLTRISSILSDIQAGNRAGDISDEDTNRFTGQLGQIISALMAIFR